MPKPGTTKLPVQVAGITIGWVEINNDTALSDLKSIKPSDIITDEPEPKTAPDGSTIYRPTQKSNRRRPK
jgi:hypothetical protein